MEAESTKTHVVSPSTEETEQQKKFKQAKSDMNRYWDAMANTEEGTKKILNNPEKWTFIKASANVGWYNVAYLPKVADIEGEKIVFMQGDPRTARPTYHYHAAQ